MVRAQRARLNESKNQQKISPALNSLTHISQKSAILRCFLKYTDNPRQLEVVRCARNPAHAAKSEDGGMASKQEDESYA